MTARSSLQNLSEQKVLCPHCWHKFYKDEALYIARHPDFLSKDEVLGNMIGQFKRFALNEATRDRSGKVLDPKGWEMIERACPRCHLQVPADLLQRRPFIVSVAGSPRSGKTYFLTTMLHGLRKEMTSHFGFSWHDSDSHFVETFQRYENVLFASTAPESLTLLEKTHAEGDLYNEVTLDGTLVRLPKPFIFSLRPTEANLDIAQWGAHLHRNIVMYDNAGESFMVNTDVGAVRSTLHLGQCDAVLFALDPLQHPEVLDRLRRCSHDPQLASHAFPFRQETVFQEMVHRMRRHRGVGEDHRLDALLSVAVQKFDVWRSLVPHAVTRTAEGAEQDNIDHTSVDYVAAKGIAGLDVEEINAVSLLIRAFLNDVFPEIVALAEASFRKVRYFPVSALGTSPEGQDPKVNLKVRPADVRPFRVTHPMLWLFQEWTLIRRMKPKPERAAGCPTVEIESVGGGRIRFLNPYTQALASLEEGYSGGTVVCPTTGKRFRIPQVPRPLPSAPLPPQPSSGSPPLPPPLPPPPKPKEEKRGWFRRKGTKE